MRERTVRMRKRGEVVIPIRFRRRLGWGEDTLLTVQDVGEAVILRSVPAHTPMRRDEDAARSEPSWGSDLFRVYELLRTQALSPEEIKDELEWSLARVYSALLELVVRGVVSAQRGGRYSVCVDPHRSQP